MKNYIKRTVIGLLALCIAVSVSVPVALAAEADPTAVPDMEYRFSDYATNGEYLAKCTKNIYISYGARTLNWRFEAASNNYQFRVQELHPEAPGTGKNMFIADTMQFFGAENWWYALRIQSPGTGKYALTLNKGGKAQTEVYFLSARAVEQALGDNAAAYAETFSEDPYLAGGTEAFTKYFEVIQGMLESAAPVMNAVPVKETVMTGECSFSSEDEYIMVIKYVSEGSLTTQISSLSATRIGEAENIPGGDLLERDDGTNFDIKFVLIPAAVVLVAVTVAVIVSRKKKTKE